MIEYDLPFESISTIYSTTTIAGSGYYRNDGTFIEEHDKVYELKESYKRWMIDNGVQFPNRLIHERYYDGMVRFVATHGDCIHPHDIHLVFPDEYKLKEFKSMVFLEKMQQGPNEKEI